jgi:cyclophilin family peptidyl-prolyl cis-trans isomerase/HEAT repeat protein
VRFSLSAAVIVLTLTVPTRTTSEVGFLESASLRPETDLRGRFQQQPITLEELQLAGDSVPRDRALLERAYASTSVAIRATAVRLLGRMETTFPNKSAADAWFGLDDADPTVRREAANAIGQGHAGDAALSAADSAKVNGRDRALLEARIRTERDDAVVGTLLQALGRLHFDAAGTTEIEHYLLAHATGAAARRLGAEFGLLALTVPRDVKARLDPATRVRLRQFATTVTTGATDTDVRVRRLAMNLLQVLNDTDTPTIAAAAKDPDWQVRRFAVMMTSLGNAALRPMFDQVLKDEAVQVRWEALRVAARGMTPCTALISATDDSEPAVVIQALGLLKASCPERDAIVKKITPIAESLRTVTDTWQVPAAALAALAKFAPAEARRLNAIAVEHKTWEVRAAAAAVVRAVIVGMTPKLFGDRAIIVRLAHDPVANVRNAAIEALQSFGDQANVGHAAIDALESNDHQLVRTAARALNAPPVQGLDPAAPSIERKTSALLAALGRLTKLGKDNSRDARLAIIEAFRNALYSASVERLRPYLTDYDPAIAASAAAIMNAKGPLIAKDKGTTFAEVAASPHLRPLEQPTLADLRALPTHATIKMVDGSLIELELLPLDAPVTVWRFASLAKKGYYNGLTFHRIVPNFVVQGGSPGANEYLGDTRFMRDEEGLASQVRGAVGISTRGRDTGDAQIFIDLVDVPRLDHDYTVFARVQSGMAAVDRMLEGAKIASVTVR